MSSSTCILLVATLAVVASVAQLVVGLVFWDGRAVAFACVSAGLAIAGHAFQLTLQAGQSLSLTVLRVCYSVAAGLAVYFNSAWCLWVLGLPVGLAFVGEGRVAQALWQGPGLVLLCVGCYVLMRLKAFANLGRNETASELDRLIG